MKAIVLCAELAQVQELIDFLQSDGVEAICLQVGMEVTSLPCPEEAPLILLTIPDEHVEEGHAQLLEWKKLYPSSAAMLLPLGSKENWEFAVKGMIKVGKAK